MIKLAPLAIVLAALAGCAERVANPCPGSPEPHCLTRTVCATDSARGCQVCRCESPYDVPLQGPPQGPPQPVPP